MPAREATPNAHILEQCTVSALRRDCGDNAESRVESNCYEQFDPNSGTTWKFMSDFGRSDTITKTNKKVREFLHSDIHRIPLG